jgi:hypothetical protein
MEHIACPFKFNPLLRLTDIIAGYSENYMKHIYKFCRQKAYGKAYGTYCHYIRLTIDGVWIGNLIY